jgi:hypothetical protein
VGRVCWQLADLHALLLLGSNQPILCPHCPH